MHMWRASLGLAYLIIGTLFSGGVSRAETVGTLDFCGSKSAEIEGIFRSRFATLKQSSDFETVVSLQLLNGDFRCEGVSSLAYEYLSSHFARIRLDHHVFSTGQINESLVCVPQYLVSEEEIHFVTVLLPDQSTLDDAFCIDRITTALGRLR